uniref:Uncharacterized protein n=2 Tax=Avena sativa TaxID=4498 RepID=A0ACD5XSJ8_AVESA
MEFAARGRSTAAVDGAGAGDGRRFSNPQPPHGRDTHSVAADMAALGFRREELLREFHRERIRLDMILCDLAETERAMTACLAMPAAGWSACCARPSMHQCGETLYRAPWSSEETSWWRRNPSEPVTPPVYPYIERSPSPVDAEQQECGSSSRALAVAPSACPDAEQRWSLSKESAVEALVQAAINAVNPMESALLSEEVALESQDAVNQERGHELMESHGVQLTESGIKRSEEPKCPANGEKRGAETKNSHAMQLMESELQRSEHPMHASVVQESEAEVKDCHPMQLMECEVHRSERIKRAAVGQGCGTKADTSLSVQVMENNFQKSDQVNRGSLGQEKKAEVKDSHGVLMESEIQRSEQPKLEASGQDHEAEEKDRHAMQLLESGIQGSKQSKPAQPTINGCIDELRELPRQYALAGKEKSPPKEQKRLVANKPKTQITPSGVKERSVLRINRQKPLEESSCIIGQVNLTCEEHLTQHQAGELHGSNLAVLQSRQGASVLTAKSTPVSSHRPRVRPISNIDMESEIQRSEQPKCSALGQERAAEVQLMEKEIQRSEQTRCEAFGEEHKAEEKDSHAVQLMKESGIQSREQPKPVEPTFRGGIDEPHAPSVKEKSPSNEHERLVVNEPKTQITPGGVKRRPIMRINREKPLEESSCNLGLVNLTREEDLTQHQAGELHRPNLAVLQSRQGAEGLTAKLTPESSHRACNGYMESEIQRSEQPKRSALGQEREAEAKNSHAVQLKENKMQRSEQTKREALGEERKAEEKDSHAGQLMKEIIIQSSEQPKPAKPTFRDGIDEHMQSPHALSDKEKSPSNEHKRLVFNETKTQITPSGVKRPIVGPTVTTPPPKRHKPLGEWGCNLCQVNLTSEEDLTQHKAGELHRSNLATLRAKQEASGFDLRNHLRGRSHQESTRTHRTEEGGNEADNCATDRLGTEDPRKNFLNKRRFPFCKLCKVECTSQKVMESHLRGKKHRENVQARH